MIERSTSGTEGQAVAPSWSPNTMDYDEIFILVDCFDQYSDVAHNSSARTRDDPNNVIDRPDSQPQVYACGSFYIKIKCHFQSDYTIPALGIFAI